MNWLRRNVHGIGLALIVAVCSHLLGMAIPLVGGAVFGIVLGIIINNTFGGSPLATEGLNFTSRKILQWAIILLGSGLSLQQVYSTGLSSLVVILGTMSVAFIAVSLAGKMLRVHFNLASLIGVGTAICGGSAIAAVSPIIEAEDQEVAYSISTVFLFNVIAVMVFPTIGHVLGLSQNGFGLFAGTAINDTSSVVAAGYTYGNHAGDYATVVKLTRTIMIIPVALLFVVVMFFRKRKAAKEGRAVSFKPMDIFPWFIVGFLVASTLYTVGVLNNSLVNALKEAGKFMIVLALTAIGLKTDVRRMLKTGPRPLLLGLTVWIGVAVTSISIQLISHQW